MGGPKKPKGKGKQAPQQDYYMANYGYDEAEFRRREKEAALLEHQHLQQEEKNNFYRTESAKKKAEALPIEMAHTWLEGKLKKPEKVSDLGDYWVDSTLKLEKFVPLDFFDGVVDNSHIARANGENGGTSSSFNRRSSSGAPHHDSEDDEESRNLKR